jgi:hypothetical protein
MQVVYCLLTNSPTLKRCLAGSPVLRLLSFPRTDNSYWPSGLYLCQDPNVPEPHCSIVLNPSKEHSKFAGSLDFQVNLGALRVTVGWFLSNVMVGTVESETIQFNNCAEQTKIFLQMGKYSGLIVNPLAESVSRDLKWLN